MQLQEKKNFASAVCSTWKVCKPRILNLIHLVLSESLNVIYWGTFWKTKQQGTSALWQTINQIQNPPSNFLKIIHRGLPLLAKLTYNKFLCWNQNSKLFKPGGNGTHTKSYKLTHRKYVNCNAKIAMPSLS